MLEEQLAIVHGLWTATGRLVVQGGRFYSVDGCAGSGREPTAPASTSRRRRGLARARCGIAARYADEFNLSSSSPERAREQFARLDAACRAAGRDPATLARSAMVGTLVGRRRGRGRAADRGARHAHGARSAMGRRTSGPTPGSPSAPRWIIGTPDEARAMVRRFAEAGVERIMLQDFLPWDLEMIDLHGRGAGRPGLTRAAASARLSPRPRPPPRGSAGRRAGSGRGSCRGPGRAAR